MNTKPDAIAARIQIAAIAKGVLPAYGFLASLVVPLRAADPPPAPILRIETGMHTEAILSLAEARSGRLILTCGNDKTARLWEVPSGRLLRVLRPAIGEGNEGRLYACALSPDGTLAALGGWTNNGRDLFFESILIFDTATGQMVQRLSNLPINVTALAFSQKGDYLAAGFGGGKGLRIWKTKPWQEVGSDFGYLVGMGDSAGVDWSPDNHIVLASNNGTVWLYRVGPRGLEKITWQVLTGQIPSAARFSPDGQKIAVSFDDASRVAVYQGADLKPLYAPDTTGMQGGLHSVAWSKDGTALAAGGMWSVQVGGAWSFPIRIWADSGRGRFQDYPAAINLIVDLRSLPEGGFCFASTNPDWGVLNAKGERTLFHPSPASDYRGADQKFRLSSDGTVVAFGYEEHGNAPARFSVLRRLLEIDPKDDNQGLHSPLLTGLKLNGVPDSTTPTLNGKPLSLEDNETSRCVAISQDASRIYLGADFSLRSFDSDGQQRWKAPLTFPVWAVNVADHDRLAVAAFADGTIRWFRAEDGQELLAFFPHTDKKRWGLWTPQGYYDCSPGAEDLIGWHVNRGPDHAADFYPESKLRNQFHRPDLIDQALKPRDTPPPAGGKP